MSAADALLNRFPNNTGVEIGAKLMKESNYNRAVLTAQIMTGITAVSTIATASSWFLGGPYVRGFAALAAFSGTASVGSWLWTVAEGAKLALGTGISVVSAIAELKIQELQREKAN